MRRACGWLASARWWLPAPVLLTAVVAVQLTLSQWGPLHTWKGGGFAMFASNDDRVLQVHVTRGADCLSHGAVWPEALALEQRRLANYPSERGLRAHAGDLAGGDWRFYFDRRERSQLRMTLSRIAERLHTYMAFPAEPDGVQIDAWRLRFRPEGEDRNLNGRLDPGEDAIPNGYIDAPLVMPERIAHVASERAR